VLAAVAYYASGKGITPLLNNRHHLVTRVKTNAAAYLPAPKLAKPGKGRPRIYRQTVRLKDMAADDSAFTSAPSPVYGKRDVMVRFRVLDLLWKPVGRIVRFCIVHHPSSMATASRSSWGSDKPFISWSLMPITSGCLV
jgi:hypothetical protein